MVSASRSLVVVALVAACSDSEPPLADDPPPRSADVEPVAPFAQFSQRTLYIAALARPVAPPLTVGSTHAAELLETSDDSVVSIDGEGNLVAHLRGEAVILGTPAGSALVVEVRPASTLALDPPEVTLAPGARTQVAVLADGEPLPADAVAWAMSDPGTVAVDRGQVAATGAPGEAQIVATYGGLTVEGRVRVTPLQRGALAVIAPAQKLHAGSVTRLALSTPELTGVTWTSDRSAVLESLGDGVYRAARRGRAKACARANGQTSCASLEVIP